MSAGCANKVCPGQLRPWVWLSALVSAGCANKVCPGQLRPWVWLSALEGLLHKRTQSFVPHLRLGPNY